MIAKPLLALALLCGAIPAAAQKAEFREDIGNWVVMPVTATACQMVAAFGDHVMVSISEDATGRGAFIFSDDRWLLKEGDTKPATISWDGWKTSQETSFSPGKTESGRWLLVSITDSGFTENLAGPKHFWLRVPGVDFDDDFDIPNFLDVLAVLHRCNDTLGRGQ